MGMDGFIPEKKWICGTCVLFSVWTFLFFFLISCCFFFKHFLLKTKTGKKLEQEIRKKNFEEKTN
jgi:hypothetical protein